MFDASTHIASQACRNSCSRAANGPDITGDIDSESQRGRPYIRSPAGGYFRSRALSEREIGDQAE